MFYDSVVAVIAKEDILKLNFKNAELLVRMLVKNGKKSFGTLNLFYEGYDDDPRELFEIDEVRAFARELVNRFPYIFLYLSDASGSIKMLFNLISDETISIKLGELKTAREYINEGNRDPRTYHPVVSFCSLSVEKRQKIYRGIRKHAKELRANLRGEELVKEIEAFFGSSKN